MKLLKNTILERPVQVKSFDNSISLKSYSCFYENSGNAEKDERKMINRIVKDNSNILITLYLLFNSIFAIGNDTIVINKKQFFIDYNKQIIISNLDVEWVNATWPSLKKHILLNELCEFSSPFYLTEIGKAYEIFIPSIEEPFKLYFTELPIISIATKSAIVDNPLALADFRLIESNQDNIQSYIGIQFRGAFSLGYPKKSMEFQFYKDTSGNENRDFALLGMKNDDGWNLQAMYNEPLRIRSKTNSVLWNKINKLHYQNIEPEAINGIRMKYVELLVNGEYQGVYCLGEKVNRKHLKLKKYNGNIQGELYKGIGWGASTFTSLASYNNNSLLWGGFEYKHPKEKTDWANLHNLVDFVINSTNDVFFQHYYNRFDMDNIVDYFIFLNLLRATDNFGKNIYIAKYDKNSKYFYVPWDLDGSFGTIYNGSKDVTTNDILLNGFYERLMEDCYENGFKAKLKTKWLALRSTIVTHDSLMSIFHLNHDFLLRNGVFERESLVWPDFNYNGSDELSYLSRWIKERIAYLDLIFMEDCIPLSIISIKPESSEFIIYPNPTNDLLFFNLNSSRNFNVYVYNNTGQIVLQRLNNVSTETMSLKSLNKGLYFIKLEDKEHIEYQSIMLTE